MSKVCSQETSGRHAVHLANSRGFAVCAAHFKKEAAAEASKWIVTTDRAAVTCAQCLRSIAADERKQRTKLKRARS